MKRWLTPEMLVLTALSAVTHFWRLFTPNAVVFDEVHYKHFAGHYLDGTHYFDVHPPLGKLLYAALARALGVPAAAMLGPDPVVVLRVLPAFFGTLMVPLAYIIVRQLGAARRVATLAAFAVLCENALLVDSRFALLEPMIIGFGLIAISLYLAARGSSGNRRLVLLVCSALAAGCAIAVKWTGASALGLIVATWLLDEARRRRPNRRTVVEGVILAGIPLLVYVAAFAIHFALLTRAGVDDIRMSSRFRATLIGDPKYDPAVGMPLLGKISDLQRAMSTGNRSLELTIHPAASPWYTWPGMKHPIGLWENPHPAAGQRETIILLGNPVIWWGGWVVVILAAVSVLRNRIRWRDHTFAVAFLGGGFLVNFVPFIAIRRVMYLYHYLFALMFLILLASYCVGVLGGWNGDDEALWRFPSRQSAVGYWTVVALILVGFLYFLPFTFGWSIGQAAYDARFWVLHPRL